MSDTIPVGDTRKLTKAFTVSGVATDPTTVTLAVTDPSGNQDTYTYAAAQITKDSTGNYSKSITFDEAGVWQYIWTGTGTAADVKVGTVTVTQATVAGTLYCQLDELRSWHGHADLSSTGDDLELLSAIQASSRAIDLHCGRRFYKDTTATARVYFPEHGGLVRVDDFYTTTDLAVKTDEGDDGTYETTWTSSDYQLEPLNGVVSGMSGWPYNRIAGVNTRRFPTCNHIAPVQVTAKWGWAAIPDAVRMACLIKSARLFTRRNSPHGITGVDAFGPVRVGRQEDPDVVGLLAPFVRHVLVA